MMFRFYSPGVVIAFVLFCLLLLTASALQDIPLGISLGSKYMYVWTIPTTAYALISPSAISSAVAAVDDSFPLVARLEGSPRYVSLIRQLKAQGSCYESTPGTDKWERAGKRSLPNDMIFPSLFETLTEELGKLKLATEQNLSRPVNYTFIDIPDHLNHAAQYVVQTAAEKSGFWAPYIYQVHRTVRRNTHHTYGLGNCRRYNDRYPCLSWEDHPFLIADYNDDSLGLFLDDHGHGRHEHDPDEGGAIIELHAEYPAPSNVTLPDGSMDASEWFTASLDDFFKVCKIRFRSCPIEFILFIGDGSPSGFEKLESVLKQRFPDLKPNAWLTSLPPSHVGATGAARHAKSTFDIPGYWTDEEWARYKPYEPPKHDEL